MSCDTNTSATPTPGVKISQLNTLSPIVDDNDLFIVVDVTGNETKNVTYETMITFDNSGTNLSANTFPDTIIELDEELSVHMNDYSIHYPMSAIDVDGIDEVTSAGTYLREIDAWVASDVFDVDNYYTSGQIDSMSGGYATSADLDTHISNYDIHRELDDSGTSNIDLWSAEKIISSIGSAGGGDVIGPIIAVDNHIVTFDGTTGNIIKDSGYTIETSVPNGAVFTDTIHFIGQYPTLTDLVNDNLTPIIGDFGYVNEIGVDVKSYIWDDDDDVWVNSAQGDMLKSVYDKDNDIIGVVDSSNKNIIKTLNVSGNSGSLTAMTSNYDANPIGVLINNGIAVTSGPVSLNVFNRVGSDAILQAGAYVYMDTINLVFGAVKSPLPSGQLRMGDGDVYLGTIAVTTGLITNSTSALVEIILDIRKSSIENPTSDGYWLRKNENDINSWTEDINGGSY